MSGKDREQRLGTASTLHEAIRSLGKVTDLRRAEFIHDRLMSAIDDICHERLKSGTKFTPAQILVLKDIAFQIVYILDQRNNRHQGFFSALWAEFKQLSPLKKLGLVSGIVLTIFGIVGGAHAGYQQFTVWWIR
jgi:hypothetical protein